MTAKIIDGRAVADRIQTELRDEVARFTAQYGYPPGLGVVLVGENPASQMYVRMKRKACARVGIASTGDVLPADSTQAQVEAAVRHLNDDPHVHGILVQLPMPGHIDEKAVLQAVSIDKDVDGFHPTNMGLLAMKGRQPTFTPATPTGCMTLLEEAGAELSGANAVVIGRSNIVGLPMALLLNNADATVTICHSRTRNTADIVRQADIVIAAIGQPEFVKGDWIKPGATVIDVGSNVVEADNDKGYRYVGDVDYEAACEVAGAITQVPGGVGPMTITTLLTNTMKAAWRIAGG